MAYITMNGVMSPCVSAGSNHVGASEMCTPHVICPSGAAPAGAAIASRASTAQAAKRTGRIIDLLIAVTFEMRGFGYALGIMGELRGLSTGRDRRAARIHDGLPHRLGSGRHVDVR